MSQNSYQALTSYKELQVYKNELEEQFNINHVDSFIFSDDFIDENKQDGTELKKLMKLINDYNECLVKFNAEVYEMNRIKTFEELKKVISEKIESWVPKISQNKDLPLALKTYLDLVSEDIVGILKLNNIKLN